MQYFIDCALSLLTIFKLRVLRGHMAGISPLSEWSTGLHLTGDPETSRQILVSFQNHVFSPSELSTDMISSSRP